ncbi:MAG: aspartyl protease family protein [Bacteroidota bacterium]
MALLLLGLCQSVPAQREFGFKLPNNTRKVEIPFKQHNNLIVIPITINRFLTLKFILDTGVETAILTEKLYADILKLNYLREISIAGPGIIDSVQAYVANQATFALPGGIVGQNMNVLVLKEDYLKLSENIGDEIHGIIGYDVFSRFVVDIDYDENILTLHHPKKYKKSRRAITVPIEIRSSKPFVSATVKQGDEKKNLDIMIDTGASHAALLDYQFINGIDVPETKIETRLGRGIAGDIPGFVGRMDSVQIDCFGFDEMLVSAPFEGAYNKVIKRGARVGTFGGDLLTRFRVTFDYPRKRIYLRKGDEYKDNFEYNMSGMNVNAVGDNLDTLKVVSVDKSSPAYGADIRKGDVIHTINGKNLRTHQLSDIFFLLRSRDGKKIRCKIYRGEEKLRKKFYLKRVI